MTRSLFATLAAAAILLLLESTALACACCDGYGRRSVRGWSSSGRSAIVEHDVWAGCEHRRTLEVWRMGAQLPSHCFDHFGEDPDARIECHDAVSEFEAREAGRSPGTSTRRRFFPQEVSAIHAKHLRVTLARVAPSEDSGCLEPRVLTVAMRVAPTEPIFSSRICLGAPDDVAEELAEGEWMPNEITVEVHPSPSGQRALVAWRGDDGSPGIGDFDTGLSWGRLPAAVREPADLRPLLTTNDGDGAVLALPQPGPRARGAERRVANRSNREGLALHRTGSYSAAADAFHRAIWRDPGHVMAWYNLACSEARRGRPLQAIDILRILDEWDCPRCSERIRRAATDPDLAPLVRDPEMRWLLEANAD